MSTPPRRPRQPSSVTRTSYHVGRPWMLDGKMLRAATGTPIRSTAFANSAFADAEPEPLTLENLMTKSLTRVIVFTASLRDRRRRLRGSVRDRRRCRPCARRGPRVRHLEQELLHVPRAGRAALGAHPAVQAHVLVLHHDAARLQRPGDVEILVEVARRRAQARAQV